MAILYCASLQYDCDFSPQEYVSTQIVYLNGYASCVVDKMERKYMSVSNSKFVLQSKGHAILPLFLLYSMTDLGRKRIAYTPYTYSRSDETCDKAFFHHDADHAVNIPSRWVFCRLFMTAQPGICCNPILAHRSP